MKVAELETLITSKEELGDDKPHGNFFARTLPRMAWDRPWMQCFERVVLVHRLREVVAQVGFTRFEAARLTLRASLRWEYAGLRWPARSSGSLRSRIGAKESSYSSVVRPSKHGSRDKTYLSSRRHSMRASAAGCRNITEAGVCLRDFRT